MQAKTDTLSAEECGDFYAEHAEKPFFASLVSYMGSGRVRLLVLETYGAIAKWRDLIGRTDAEEKGSLRAQFGKSKEQNGLHGSDSFASAEREIGFFFPELRDEKPGAESVQAYLAREITPALTVGLAEVVRLRPKDPVVGFSFSLQSLLPRVRRPLETWLAEWLNERASLEN